MEQAGVPDGVINVVPGFGTSAGAAVSSHMDIDMVNFCVASYSRFNEILDCLIFSDWSIYIYIYIFIISFFQVSFTGSTEVGRLVMQAAALSNLKPVCLELGGKSPFIVFNDVDVEKVADLALQGSFFNKVK